MHLSSLSSTLAAVSSNNKAESCVRRKARDKTVLRDIFWFAFALNDVALSYMALFFKKDTVQGRILINLGFYSVHSLPEVVLKCYG